MRGFGSSLRQCCENTAGMKPAYAQLTENIIPVNITRTHLTNSSICPVGYAKCAADSEASLCEVKTVAHAAADAIIRHPFDEACIDASLHDQILDQIADIIVCQRCYDCC